LENAIVHMFSSELESEIGKVIQFLQLNQIYFELRDSDVEVENAMGSQNLGKSIWVKETDYSRVLEFIEGMSSVSKAIEISDRSQPDPYGELGEYYTRVFEKFETNKTINKTTWNWWAFFLNWFWYFGHRMYLRGFVVLALIACVSLVPYGGYLNLFIFFYCGSCGNYHKYLQYKNLTSRST